MRNFRKNDQVVFFLMCIKATINLQKGNFNGHRKGLPQIWNDIVSYTANPTLHNPAIMYEKVTVQILPTIYKKCTICASCLHTNAVYTLHAISIQWQYHEALIATPPPPHDVIRPVLYTCTFVHIYTTDMWIQNPFPLCGVLSIWGTRFPDVWGGGRGIRTLHHPAFFYTVYFTIVSKQNSHF